MYIISTLSIGYCNVLKHNYINKGDNFAYNRGVSFYYNILSIITTYAYLDMRLHDFP